MAKRPTPHRSTLAGRTPLAGIVEPIPAAEPATTPAPAQPVPEKMPAQPAPVEPDPTPAQNVDLAPAKETAPQPAERVDEEPAAVVDQAPADQPEERLDQKLQAYFTVSELNRVRAAWLHTHATTGYTSLSEMQSAVMLREVERLEREYNGGQPWPPLPAGRLLRRHRR